MRRLILCSCLVAIILIAATPAASAASPEQQLADRYAPIVALEIQPEPCHHGEGWRPTTVETVLGRPEVVLRRRGPGDPIVKRAPTAADLFGKGEEYYLDLPGHPLTPGCTYERDATRFSRGQPAIAYARLVQERGQDRVALQYWFYYYFNDFNDKHESDWEGIQLSFDAGSASEALGARPVEVAYAQHGGGERAAWNSTDLERVGDHPLVYVAAGSHASYFSSALWLGRSTNEGWGCDDTRGPARRVPLQAVLLPAHVDARSPFAWLAYDGRWGEREKGPNNGPTGPTTKSRWTEPLTWQDDLRENSFRVPGGVTLGTSVTGAFCGAVEFGSSLIIYALIRPGITLAVCAALVALIAFAISRTRWRPASATPLRARRAAGQILRSSRRIYWQQRRVLLAIGAVSVPLAFAAYLVGVASGPLVGFVLLLFTSLPPAAVDLIGSIVYAFTLPYIAVATTLHYFDLQASKQESAAAVRHGRAAIAGT